LLPCPSTSLRSFAQVARLRSTNGTRDAPPAVVERETAAKGRQQATLGFLQSSAKKPHNLNRINQRPCSTERTWRINFQSVAPKLVRPMPLTFHNPSRSSALSPSVRHSSCRQQALCISSARSRQLRALCQDSDSTLRCYVGGSEACLDSNQCRLPNKVRPGARDKARRRANLQSRG
jgi:hypothetical protein